VSRRRSRATEAEIDRAMKVAERRGAWAVDIRPDGTIRLLREKDSGEKAAEEQVEFERFADRVV
jgi:hypothetical protein